VSARPPRTYTTQQQVEDARWEARRDLVIEDHGSVCLLRPMCRRARRWLREHVDPAARWWGPPNRPALVVEPRYVVDIVAGAREAGLVVR
jgi:hypothetical protein